MPRRLTALGLLVALAAPAAAQLPPDKALASLKPADGLQVELFAAEPMLINPTSMDVDHLGRVWVCEAVNYRRKNFNRPILRKEGDRIVILTDKDGDGKADESTVFYQGEDLYGPLGIAVAKDAKGPGYKVFVCQSPDILLFTDADGDGKADGKPEKFLTGFGGFDHDHGVHGILIGPDGKLYFTVGDSGVTGLQSKDGKGRKWVTTKDPKGDCQAGTVWRCDFDGTNLELIAHNFRNNYEACVDSFGEVWLSDNDDDGNQQTRICHVMPGGNFGYWPRGAGQTHWHEEQPGIVHKTLRTGFGSPTGITFYEGTLLPEKYRGHLLHTDAGPRELRAFLRKPKGAGYELEKVDLLTSTDSWFRPSDVTVAPDGSVFVCDWYDPGVGGHGMGDWTRGRVYRVTPKGHVGYKVPAVKLDTKEGVLAALGSPCLATRAIAIDRLKTTPTLDAIRTLSEGLGGDDEAQMARAFWHLSVALLRADKEKPTMAPGESKQLATALYEFTKRAQDLTPLKCMMTRLQLQLGGVTPARQASDPRWLSVFAEKSNMAVCREALLCCRAAPAEQLTPLFYALAKKYDGKDHFYRAALNIAAGTDPARRDAILADFDQHFPEWNDTVADLVWELRPKSVLPRLTQLLGDAKPTPAQKGRIVDILAVNDDPAAGTAMLGLLAADHPPEVTARALENLRLFLPGKWSPIAKSDDLKTAAEALLKEPKTRMTGLKLVAVANHLPAVPLAQSFAADPDVPPDVRIEAVRTLGQLRDLKAVESLVQLSAAQPDLSVECAKALANHLPAGPKPTPGNTLAMDALQRAVTAPKSPPELKSAALTALAGTRAGTGWLLQLKEQGKMPEAITADAGRLLRNSPFQGERNKAMLLFPAPGKLDPKKLPAPAELAKRTGNAANGQKVMAASLTGEAQCLKCHTVRGTGGQIGPDLSMIGKKGSKENLFESILAPSKAIADQHVSWKIDTADGQALTGLIVAETETTVTLRDANGKDYPIPVKDVDKRTKSLVSLMPDNLAAALTEDELVDLVEYLTTLQTAALTPDVWQLAGPFPGGNQNAGLDVEHGPGKGFDPKATFDTKAGQAGWRPVRPTATGYVDLAAFHGASAADSVSYLYAEFESPADQDAEVLLGHDDGANLYVNGQLRHTEKVTRAAAPEQARVAVKLKKGTNAVLLKIANGNGPHGFYLTILSGQELKMVK